MATENVKVKFSQKGAKAVKNAFRGIGTAAKTMLKALGPLYLAMIALQKAGEGLKASFNIKQQIDGVSKGFQGLSKGMDFTSKSMKNLQGAVKGTMSQMELMKQTNNALLLGVVESEDEMGRLLKAAQSLGEAVGKDTTFAVESLVTGMGRQSRLMLDNLGIIVDSKKAYQDYAKELGKNVLQLTEAERKQAFLNAALEQAEFKASQVGEVMETTGVKMARVMAQMQDIGASLGTTLDPIFKIILDGVSFVLSGIQEYFDYLEEVKSKIDMEKYWTELFNFDFLIDLWVQGMQNQIKVISLLIRSIPFLFKAAMDFLAPLVVEGLEAVGRKFQEYLPEIGDFIAKAFDAYFDLVQNNWALMFDGLALGAETGVHFLLQHFERMSLRIKNVFIDMLNHISGKFNEWIETLNIGLKVLGLEELEGLGTVGKKTMEELTEEQKKETASFVEGQALKAQALTDTFLNAQAEVVSKLAETDLAQLLIGEGEITSFQDIMDEYEKIYTDSLRNLGLIKEESSEQDEELNNANTDNELGYFQKIIQGRQDMSDEEKRTTKEGWDLAKQNLVEAGKTFPAFAKMHKAAALTELAVTAPKVVSDAFASGMRLPFPAPIPFLAAVAQAGLASAQMASQISSIKKAETGFEGQVTSPTMFLAGERGQAENVSVTPLNNPNIRGNQASSGAINIMFEGNVMSQEFIDDSVPMIQDAIRRGL